MDRPETGTSQRPGVPEDTILKYRPNVEDRLLPNNLPGALLIATIPFLVVYEVAGGGLVGAVLGALAAAAGLWALSSLAAPSVTAEVRADSVRFLYALTKPQVRFEQTGRIKIARGTQWGEARAAVERKGAKKGVFVWSFKSPETPIPGDLRFQAEVVAEILKRRRDIPVDEDAARLLTGKLGLQWRYRLPVVIASGVATAVMAYLLVVSIWQVAAPALVVMSAPITAVFSASAMSLKRESGAQAVIASLGLGVVAVLFIVFGVANAYGYLEYMPLVYAAGVTCCAAGLLASLPLRIGPLHLAVGETVLLVVLVGLTWSMTLRGTIPVRQVRLKPSPMDAYFSPNGNAIVTDGTADKRHAVHFIDRRSLQSATVSVDFHVMWPVPVGEDAALCTKTKPGLQQELWFVRAGREPRRIPTTGRVGLLSRSALSPDGRRFAFFASEVLEEAGRRRRRYREGDCRLFVLDLGTTAAKETGLVLERPPAWSHVLTWRPDGRLAWADSAAQEDEAARFRLQSWAPGDESPRLEFESAEKWSTVQYSPGLKKALASVHRAGGKVASIFDLSDGTRVDLPGPLPGGGPQFGLQWSSDARRCAYIPEEDTRSVVVLDTESGKPSVLRGPVRGEVGGLAISPSGRHVAFSISGSFWSWTSAIYVSNLETGSTRRLRPLPGLSGVFSLWMPGTQAWSPTGDALAVAVHAFPAASFLKNGGGSLWVADRLP